MRVKCRPKERVAVKYRLSAGRAPPVGGGGAKRRPAAARRCAAGRDENAAGKGTGSGRGARCSTMTGSKAGIRPI